MARRRGRFRRIKPDMGWYLSPFRGEYTYDGTNATNLIELMAFAEIDGDEGIIAKDKSDWFIKRVVADMWFQLDPGTVNGTNDTMKVVPWMLATITAASAIDMASSQWPVNEPDGFDAARRVLQTGWSPAYLPAGLVTEGTLGADFGAIETKAAPVTTVSYRAPAPFLGPQLVHLDFPVSSAGLVPDSSLYLATTTDSTTGPASYTWINGDGYSYYVNLKVLLQKRIG